MARTHFLRPSRALGASLLMWAAAGSAGAQTAYCGPDPCAAVPDAVGTVQVSASSDHLPGPPPGGTIDGVNGGASIDYLPTPLVGAHSQVGSAIVGDVGTNVANADLVYHFRIVSLVPFTGTVFVPITLSGNYTFESHATPGQSQADAALTMSLNLSGFDPVQVFVGSGDCGAGGVPQADRTLAGTYARSVPLAAGALWSVHLFAATDAMYTGGFGVPASVSAFIDPAIVIADRCG